jgi:hypothetical protein
VNLTVLRRRRIGLHGPSGVVRTNRPGAETALLSRTSTSLAGSRAGCGLAGREQREQVLTVARIAR